MRPWRTIEPRGSAQSLVGLVSGSSGTTTDMLHHADPRQEVCRAVNHKDDKKIAVGVFYIINQSWALKDGHKQHGTAGL